MRNYMFPYKQLCKGLFSNVVRMKCLKALSLKCIKVCEEALDGILTSCPVLKFLSIHGSGELLSLKISGPSLMLKYLEIVFCLGIETIKISNVNLLSFSYLGPGINLVINNVPMLDEISIGKGYSGLENNVFGQLSCCLYQLEVLTLDIYRLEDNINIFAFPELPNLKQLILKVGAWNDDSLLEFTSLIKACPNLNRFVLQVLEFVSNVHELCVVLSTDFFTIVTVVHPSLKDARGVQSKSTSDYTLAGLAKLYFVRVDFIYALSTTSSIGNSADWPLEFDGHTQTSAAPSIMLPVTFRLQLMKLIIMGPSLYTSLNRSVSGEEQGIYIRIAASESEGPEESNDEELELPMYDLAIVTKATNSFSNSNKLGEGGFGPVYKGMLEDGQEIIRSDQTRMNGIGLTSRSDRRISHSSIPDSKSIKDFKGEKIGGPRLKGCQKLLHKELRSSRMKLFVSPSFNIGIL
ncbi:65-kda microtubule-associated protein 2 [Phtheirospermum japonicum]|uniref:65-kDa microtubule-associated protein 2 n=1 Tax=Phtheirospermum japonicum TaxID=374723 RepID=A0A830BW55_9LAMI|nr:65-kda microtubule-associated protein 2 [Phtheirospermum japonicum]